jgi:hypothetical protein
MAKKPQKAEEPEIDPEKWAVFESTLKRALSMKPRPHKPVKSKKNRKAK